MNNHPPLVNTCISSYLLPPSNAAIYHECHRVVVYEPNGRILRYIRSTLEPVYNLKGFYQESLFLQDLTTSRAPDLTLMAWSSMDSSANILQQVLSRGRKHPVLLLSASANWEELAGAVRLGASGVIQKPFLGVHLKETLRKHLHANAEEADKDTPEETPLGDGYSFVRSSKQMRAIKSDAALVAQSGIPVLILGESGTGKEILARYIHSMSKRNGKMFLKLNCAAMPVDLLESELFGYEKGAFTGAHQTKPGKFEICRGGTIFLDEIGEMPAALQAKLLHVLQDGMYSRLGGRSTLRTDVRVIAATNIDMKEAIAQKTFREDLYYRLNGFTLTLPPLRDRKEEIGVFARHFMRKGATKYERSPLSLEPELLRCLESHPWPGNLRELENVINRYLIIGDAQAIIQELALKPQPLPAGVPRSIDVGHKERMRSLKGTAEAIAIANVLEETKWNRKAAAARMQVSYRTLLYKIRQYELARA